MAVSVTYTKRLFIERVMRHLANEFPTTEFSITTNEMMLYVDSAIAASIVGATYNNAKLTGILETPEAFVVTTELGPLTWNTKTDEWYAELPQPPLSLPLGHSITNIAFEDGSPIFMIKIKRVPYLKFLPRPTGCSARVEGGTVYIKQNGGGSLANEAISVTMLANRTSDLDTPMDVADDVMEVVFQQVVKTCLQRFGVPLDIVKDELTSGNKSS